MSDEKKLSRRNFLRLSGGVTAAALLAACAPSTPAPTEAPAEEPEEEMAEEPEEEMAEEEPEPEPTEAPMAAEAVEISWWSFGLGLPSEEWPHGKWEGSLAEDYTALDNNASIEYQALGWDAITKLYTTIAAGAPPEIVTRAGHGQLQIGLQAGVVAEVELQDDLRDDLPPGYLDDLKYNGTNYLIPFYIIVQGSSLNMGLVEEAGAEDLLPVLSEGREEWTYDEWLALMQAMTFERDDGAQTYGYVIPTSASNPYVLWPIWLLMWTWPADTLKYSQDRGWECAMADPEGVEWLEWMYNLYAEYGITPNPSGLDNTVPGDYWDQNQNGWLVGPSMGLARQTGTTVDPETMVVTTPQGVKFRFMQQPTWGGPSMVWGGPGLDVSSLPYMTEKGIFAETVEFGHWLVNRDHQNWLAQYLMPVRVSATEAIGDDPILTWMVQNWVPNARFRHVSGAQQEEAEQWMVMWQQLFLPTPAAEVADWFCGEVARFDSWIDV